MSYQTKTQNDKYENNKKEETIQNSKNWYIVSDGVVPIFKQKEINKIKNWYIVSDGVKIELE
jgi:hypothetical protein